jgi:hypothetical protein
MPQKAMAALAMAMAVRRLNVFFMACLLDSMARGKVSDLVDGFNWRTISPAR